MLWLRHNDSVLFRTRPGHAFEPGTWDDIRPGHIRDQFGFFVDGRIVYEGDVCAAQLPGTFAGLPAFIVERRQQT